MRSPFAALALALAALLPAPLAAQTNPPPTSAPPAAVTPAPAILTPATPAACVPAEENLGGIGRARVVAFTGPIFGARVCALAAGLPFDAFTARIAAAPPPNGALVVAALGTGTAATLAVRDDGLTVLGPAPLVAAAGPPGAAGAAGTTAASATAPVAATASAAPAPSPAPAVPPSPAGPNLAPVGPWVVAPGGQIPDFNGDTAEEPRVVLGFAGQRVFVIATSPIELVDLARVLRDQPDLFGADAAFERAVLLASGPAASLVLRTASGDLTGGAPAAPAGRVLLLGKRD